MMMTPESPELLLQLLQRFLKHQTQVQQIQTLLTTQGHLVYNPPLSRWKPTLFFNTLIRAHLSFNPNKTLSLFALMLSSHSPPNSHTFPPLLKASSTLPFPSLPASLHSQIVTRGISCDPFVQTSLLVCYSQIGELMNARKVFSEIASPCVVEFNAMLDAYAKNGDMGSAFWLLRSMSRRDVVSWTSLINGFLLNGLFDEAIKSFRAMMVHDDVRCGSVRPNEATYVSALSSCANLDKGALYLGKQIHGDIIRNKIVLTVFVGTSLIDFYGKVGCLDYAIKVFNQMVVGEVCTWNAVINSLANNGWEKQALGMFEKMKEKGLRPNEVTFVAVLIACARAKLVEYGLELFGSMLSEFGVFPTMEHYGCVVDLLGRAGLLREASEFVKSMPVMPDVSVLGALLGACKIHEAIELGKEVGKRIAELQPQHCGQYITLATINAGMERWGDAADVRKDMLKAGIRRVPAYSLIDPHGDVIIP